jgi:hypothetical protein
MYRLGLRRWESLFGGLVQPGANLVPAHKMTTPILVGLGLIFGRCGGQLWGIFGCVHSFHSATIKASVRRIYYSVLRTHPPSLGSRITSLVLGSAIFGQPLIQLAI